ncbi:retinoblastoma-binding protein [Anaeramoeba flamelloides]|uniref:Retinoblastoma-binding protein n=1 Tax=Anaeramoeba flamelloides TaxID=1746091 RepID=A0AAV7ZYV6_9EUKA|nr:retinoblastoma-binding protein [Anaeramoeba flamelloides]
MTDNVKYICGIDFGSDKTGFGFISIGSKGKQELQQSPQEQEPNYDIIPRSERIKTNSSILFSINNKGQLIKPIEWGSVAIRKHQQAESLSGNLGVELFTDLKGSLLKERLTIRSVGGREFDLFEVLVGIPNNYRYITIRQLRLVFKQSGFIKNLDDNQHLLFVTESIASSIWTLNQKLKDNYFNQQKNESKKKAKNNTNNKTNTRNNMSKDNLNSLLVISVGARTTNCIKVKQIKKIPINGELKGKYSSLNQIILQPKSIQIENSPQNNVIGAYDCDYNFRKFLERLFKIKYPLNQYSGDYNFIQKQWEEIKKKMNPKWRFQNKFEILNIPIEIISKEDLKSSIKEFHNEIEKNNEENNFENFLKTKFKRSHLFNNKKNEYNKNGNHIEIENGNGNGNENGNEKTKGNRNGNLQLGGSNCKKWDSQFPTVELKISRRMLYSFSYNLQEEISNFVGEITNQNKEILVDNTEIVCIGGFSNSNLLKHLMRRQFNFVSKDQKKTTLNFDEYYSDGAVIKGSIIFGLYRNIITNQKKSKTIGFTKLKSILAETNKKEESNSVRNISNDQIFEESFQVIINKNQSYPINKKFKFEMEINILKFPELICLISTSQSGVSKDLIYDTTCNDQLLFEHQMKMSLNLTESFQNLNNNIPKSHLIKLQFEFSFIGAEMIVKLRDLVNNVVLPVSTKYNYAEFWNKIKTLHYSAIKKKYKHFLNNDMDNYYHNKIKNHLKSNNKQKNKDESEDKHRHKHRHKHKHKNKNKNKNEDKHKHKHKKNSKSKSKGQDYGKAKGEDKDKFKTQSQNNDDKEISETGVECDKTKEKREKKIQDNQDNIGKKKFLNNGENSNDDVSDNNKIHLVPLEISKEGGKKELDNK